MSLTTWHPPPITHIGGFSCHTSNGDYGRWSKLPHNSHYSPVTLTTPSSPWLQRKSSSSDYYDSDVFGSSGTFLFGRQPDTSSNITNITVTDQSSYPFATEVRKSLLSGNNNNNKNDTKTVLYTYTDPTTLNSNNKVSTSTYTPELYSTNESKVPSYRTNFTTTVKSAVAPWNQNNYSSNSIESQKESGSPSWRSVKPTTTSSLSGTSYITEPSTTRGYELYADSSKGRPTSTVSTSLYTTSAPVKNQSLHRSNSYHGPSSSTTIDSTVIPYSPVTSRTVKDRLDSWGNDRQNASTVNSIIPYSLRDSQASTNGRDTNHALTNGHSHISHRGVSEPRELLNSASSSRQDFYGGNKPHTYESYNHGLGLSRPNSAISNEYCNLEKSTANLQHKLDEINLGNNTNSSSNSLLIALSPRSSRKHLPTDWDRYLNGDRSATAPSSSEKLLSSDHFAVEKRFRSATTRKPKSILKKKSAYETVSGGESWKSYFQDNEFSGYGLYRQNTMPTMRQSSRAPLPQLARKSAGRRVHFAI